MTDDDDRVLRPYDPAEAISVAKAAKIAGRSKRTILEWVAKHGIGRKVVGRVEVSAVALPMLLDGDMAALRAYRRGDRSSERVARYLARTDIKNPQNAQNTQSRYGVVVSGEE
ncbi:hypothetical protein [Methylocystis sp.]|uniref:hypothetical protein n=1 Tax=Methylocystis sp. TaxID=1911079 RepID=UPI003D09D00D